MSADPRAALATLVSAFERHLEACTARHGDDDPTVEAAYDALIDAFEVYDSALYEATGEMTPFDVYGLDEEGFDDADEDDEGDEDDDEELDDHGDEDGGSQLYAGLDDTDFDVDRP